MLKPIEKIVFTPTGKAFPKCGDYYGLRDGSIFYKDSETKEIIQQEIYTKSIELVQPELITGKTYFTLIIRIAEYKGRCLEVDSFVYSFEHEDSSRKILESGNIYETKEEAQKVADEINLLIQEKGYFTLFQPNPEK